MISVLVINHNAGRWLPRCLSSIKASAKAGVDLETIVVDNASDDGSVEPVLRDHPDVFVEVLDTNIGFGAANNRAARLARGNRFLLLNADAWLTEGALTRLEATLDENPRLGLVAPQLRYPNGRWQTTWAPTSGVIGEAIQQVRNHLEGHSFNHRILPSVLRPLTGPGWYSGACMMLRRKAWDAVDGFDERYFLYFEDVDLCRRLVRAGWRMRTVAEAAVVHIGGGSRDTARHGQRYRASQLAYYDANRPAWETRFLRRRLARKLRRMPEGDERDALERLLATAAEPPSYP